MKKKDHCQTKAQFNYFVCSNKTIYPTAGFTFKKKY